MTYLIRICPGIVRQNGKKEENVKNNKWKSRRQQTKEALRPALLTPLYITAWIICIVVAVALDLIWRLERRIKKNEQSITDFI